MNAFGLWTFVAILAAGRGASTDATRRPSATERLQDFPCAGCLAALPPGDGPVPLLVLLHGDGQSAAQIFARWQRLASLRGVAVLAVACPVAQGCKGSFWRWDGDASWIELQVSRLSARRALDLQHLWLAGWSGGASYAGRHTQELEKTFAAIVFHGGGIEPASAVCAPPRSNFYFLVGDRNPLHPLALALRQHYDACRQPVHWTLLRGADHAHEWAALDAKALAAIFDWLAATPSQSAVIVDAEAPAL